MLEQEAEDATHPRAHGALAYDAQQMRTPDKQRSTHGPSPATSPGRAPRDGFGAAAANEPDGRDNGGGAEGAGPSQMPSSATC